MIWRSAAAIVAFAMLATANGAGYRVGVSDQAFYLPAVFRALQPELFPRDGPMLDAQGGFMIFDELLARIVGLGLPVESLFAAGQALTLFLFFAGVMLAAARISGNGWAAIAAAAALTFRHRIPGTSANSLEPYFHPRMLAFALGVLATAAVLRQRRWLAIPLIALAALVHVTTAIWFAVFLGVALAILDARFRILVAGGGIAVVTFLAWALTAGPLRASMGAMDGLWLQAVASKDSLFVSQWPAAAWLVNAGMVALLWWVHRRRQAAGDATPEDAALVWGASGLAALFLVTLPLVEMRLALPVQLQISRVFWIVDLVTTLYLVALIARPAGAAFRRPAIRRPATSRPAIILAAVLVAASTARGAYVMLVERPERALVELGLTASPWHETMAWLRRQPASVHVLADPGHAWKYGTSLRVSGRRDVFLEDVKDAAIAIYSRDVAARVVERLSVLGDFGALTPPRARELANRYDLDLLITEAELDLPIAYRNAQFRVYALGAARPPAAADGPAAARRQFGVPRDLSR